MTESWSPIFSKLVNSSVWMEPDFVRVIWVTLLAIKGGDHVARCSAFELGKMANKSEQEALDALKILSEPDKRRIEPQPYQGRRVEKVEGGWLILNGQVYEDLMRDFKRRAYQRKKQREYYSKKKTKAGAKPSGATNPV